MRSFTLLLLSFVIALAPSFAHAQASAPSTDDAAAIREADAAFAQATKERGIEGWMSYFADDAYVGTNPSVRGKLELRRFYQNLFSRRDLKLEWTPAHAELFKSGIMGYSSGRYTMSFTNFQGQTTLQNGTYLTVWQKQPDGTWKVLCDFGSQDKPEPTPKPESPQP